MMPELLKSGHLLGGKCVALKKDSVSPSWSVLENISQDSLNNSYLSTDSSGNQVSLTRYYAFGDCRNSTGTLGTDQLYTGQRLDGTGLYFYNARYYDSSIGRFISPDDVTPNYSNPQDLNRYSYVHNNPLAYNDPTGHFAFMAFVATIAVGAVLGSAISSAAYLLRNGPSHVTAGGLLGAAVAGAVSGALVGGAGVFLAPLGIAGVVSSIAVGGIASGEGYLAGQAAESVYSSVTNSPDTLSPSLEGLGRATIGGAIGRTAGQMANATVGAVAGDDFLQGLTNMPDGSTWGGVVAPWVSGGSSATTNWGLGELLPDPVTRPNPQPDLSDPGWLF